MPARHLFARYPLAQFTVLYAVGVVLTLLAHGSDMPVLARVAEAMIVIGLVATLVMSVVLLRAEQSVLAWCALVASVLLLVAEVGSFAVDDSIGIGVLVLVGWPLCLAGAFATRPTPIHPSARL